MTRRATPVDWQRVIFDLRHVGVSLSDIATELDRAVATVHGWQSLGAEPKHSDGEALLAIWAERTQIVRETVAVSA